MWSLYYPYLLMLLAFPIAMADTEDDIEVCLKLVNVDYLQEELIEIPDSEELEMVCPILLEFFKCIEYVLEEETGFTVEELAEILNGTDTGKYFTVYLNTRNLLEEVCDENSDLSKEYRKYAPCYRDVTPTSENDLCRKLNRTMLESYEFVEDTEQEEADESTVDKCTIAALNVTCMGFQIYNTCEQAAFDYYMNLIKRTTFFSSGGICPAEQLEAAETFVFGNLQEDSKQQYLYTLLFDMKKRKK